MKKYLPYICGIVTSLIFGFSFLFSKNALDTLGTFDLLFLRFLTASAAMTILVAVGFIKIDLKGKNLKQLIAVAVWQPVIYFIMETLGLKYTSSSQAGVMMAFIPVLVAILGVVILKERPKRVQVIFIILSVIGVIMTVVSGAGLNSKGMAAGIIFLFGAVFSAAMFNIFSRKASKNFTPYEITYFMMCIGAATFGIMFLVNGIMNNNLNIFHRITYGAVVSILYLGLLSSIVAFQFTNYMLHHLPASQSSVFANLTTVVSVVAGVTIRHEAFDVKKFIGASLIILGVWGTNYFAQPVKHGKYKNI